MAVQERYKEIQEEIRRGTTSVPFPVMSFNIRLDMFEDDPSNHFTKRIHRIDQLFKTWYVVITTFIIRLSSIEKEEGGEGG